MFYSLRTRKCRCSCAIVVSESNVTQTMNNQGKYLTKQVCFVTSVFCYTCVSVFLSCGERLCMHRIHPTISVLHLLPCVPIWGLRRMCLNKVPVPQRTERLAPVPTSSKTACALPSPLTSQVVSTNRHMQTNAKWLHLCFVDINFVTFQTSLISSRWSSVQASLSIFTKQMFFLHVVWSGRAPTGHSYWPWLNALGTFLC